MKCQERELLIEEVIRTSPHVEHEFDQISDDGEYEHYICKYCRGIEKRMKQPGVPVTGEGRSEYRDNENG